MMFKSALLIFRNEIKCELRTRYAANSLVMFILVTVSIIRFAIGEEKTENEIINGLLWVSVFFSNAAGITRTFVKEEEKETSLSLKLSTLPHPVFLGKLFYNFVLSFVVNVFIVVLFIAVNDLRIENHYGFWIVVLLGNFGLVASSTIISAIISKADSRSSLYPVLAFPVLIPLLVSIIFATNLACNGATFQELIPEVQILVSYAVVVTTASFMLFGFVWND